MTTLLQMSPFSSVLMADIPIGIPPRWSWKQPLNTLLQILKRIRYCRWVEYYWLLFVCFNSLDEKTRLPKIISSHLYETDYRSHSVFGQLLGYRIKFVHCIQYREQISVKIEWDFWPKISKNHRGKFFHLTLKSIHIWKYDTNLRWRKILYLNESLCQKDKAHNIYKCSSNIIIAIISLIKRKQQHDIT